MSTTSALPRQNTFGRQASPDPPGSPGWWVSVTDRQLSYARVRERAPMLSARYGSRQESICTANPDWGYQTSRRAMRRRSQEGRHD